MRFPLSILLVLLALLAPRTARAQAEPLAPRMDPRLHVATVPLQTASGQQVRVYVLDAAAGPDGAPDLALALGGIVGGGVGMFAGMFAGALLDGDADEDCIDFCFGPGLILGFLGGEALGIAGGVHLANGRRGSLPLSMLTSVGILAASLVLANEVPIMLLLTPVTQIIISGAVERRTSRDR